MKFENVLLQEVGDSLKTLTLLQEVSTALNSFLELEQTLDIITNGLVSLFGYDMSAVHLLYGDKKHLTCKSYSADSEIVKKIESRTGVKSLNYKIPLMEGSMFSKVLETKKPIITEDVSRLVKEHTDRRHLRALAPAVAKLSRIKSGVGVPLIARGEVVGIIGIGSREKIVEKDVERLANFGKQAGVAIERARLHQSLEEHARLLERTVEERTKELKEARDYLEGIISSMDENVLVIDPEFKVLKANPSFLRNIDAKLEDIVGKNCFEVVSGELMSFDCPVAEVFKTGLSHNHVCTHLDRDKRECSIEVSASPIKDEKGNVVQAVEVRRDITEKMVYEKEVRLLQRINNMLNTGAKQEEIFAAITQGLISLFGYTLSAIYLLGKERNSLICKSYSMDSKIAENVEKLAGVKAIGYEAPLLEGSPLTKTVETKEAVIVSNVVELIKSHTDKRPLRAIAPVIAKLVGINYGIGVPLLAGDKLVGTIGVGSRRELMQKDAERLARFGRQAGLAVERAVLYEDLKNAYSDVKRYAADLERSNRLKDLFTDIMRHDLLNPVGIIRNLAEMVADDERFKDSEDVRMIRGSTRKLEEIIMAASSYAKLESAEDIEWKEMDLNAIIKDAEDSLKPYFEEKHIKLEHLPEGKYIANTISIVEEVFVNLLSNAVKYSPENTKVTVNIEDAGKNWRVTVMDQGAGVPDEHKENIFDRFTRRKKEGVKGSGIGLAIVKRIADLHGGAAGVLDNQKGGSVFYFEIPKKER